MRQSYNMIYMPYRRSILSFILQNVRQNVSLILYNVSMHTISAIKDKTVDIFCRLLFVLYLTRMFPTMNITHKTLKRVRDAYRRSDA
jgi:hypothetical protein